MKVYFKRPCLLGIGDQLPNRTATPLELFFDLSFVVALTHLVAVLEHNLTLETIVYTILKFIAVFLYWIMITKYNQYFEDHTPIHKIIILLAMIPIIFLTMGGDVKDVVMYEIYTLSFITSRIFIIILWLWGSYQLKNEYLKKIVNVNYVTSINSIIMVILGILLVSPNNILVWLIIWLYILAVEIFYPLYRLSKINKGIDYCNPNIPVFDRKLQIERSTLFVILILGEGLVGTSVLVSHLANDTIIYAITLLFITFLLFWIFSDYYASHTVKLKHTFKFNYLNIIQTLGNFLIISGLVTLFEHSSRYSQLVIGLGLILFSIANIIIYNYRDEFIYEKYHYKDQAIEYNVNYGLVQKSFILNLIIGIVMFLVPLNLVIIISLVVIVLIINVILIIRGSYYLRNKEIRE